MAQTVPPSITAAPTAPQRNDRTTFSDRVDAFVTWLIAAVAQFSAVATNVYNNAVDAYNNAVSGAASASAAAASAASAAATTGVVAWVSGTTYAIGDCRYSPVSLQTYRRKTNGAGTTDPSLDATNWTVLGLSSFANANIAQHSYIFNGGL